MRRYVIVVACTLGMGVVAPAAAMADATDGSYSNPNNKLGGVTVAQGNSNGPGSSNGGSNASNDGSNASNGSSNAPLSTAHSGNGSLPFTGLDAGLLLVGGLGLAGVGAVVRRTVVRDAR